MTNGTSQWTTRPPLHHTRAGLAGATVDGDILAIGGFTFDLGSFDFVEARRMEGNGEWRDLPALHTRRGNLSAAELDGFVYAVGGGDAGIILDVVERYNPHSDPPAWESSPSLPEPRMAPGVVGFDHLLYVAGGEIPRAGNAVEVSNSVITFNPQNGEWKPVASMPTRRSRFRLVAAGDHLYAIGGISQAFQALSSVDRYHPGSHTWDQVASMNEARGLPGAVVIDDDSERIVVVGGGGGKFGAGNFIVRRSSEIYNVGDNGQWQMLEAPLPVGRVSLVCALEDDGTVLAIGGAVANGDPPPGHRPGGGP